MAAPFNLEDLAKLKSFVDFVAANPAILNMPQLDFFKKLIEKLGGKVPEGTFQMPAGAKCPFGGDVKSENKSKFDTASSSADDVDEEVPEMEAESEESEIELDMEGVIEPDNDVEQPMGDSSKTPTEEEVDKSGELRSQAAAAYSEQNFEKAIELYTQAIELNPGNALFHAKRGQAFLKLKKPNACIRDCNKALEINCDSAAAYKFRGRAHRLLGNWEEAAKDLRQACKLDYDEECDEWLREVTPNAKKIEQHRLKQQRKKDERERKAEELRRQKAREQQAKQQKTSPSSAGAGGFPGGFPGSAGGFPAGMNMGDLLSGMKDPEVMAALQDIASNPANVEKYMSNPKIAKLINVVKNSFPGGVPGFPGGFPGAAAAAADGAGADGAGATPQPSAAKADEPKEAPKKPDFVDDGLD